VRAEGAARFAPGAREGAQPNARKYVEVSRLWQDQIAISQ